MGVFKGQELAFELSEDWQIDYASYEWKKFDSKSEECIRKWLSTGSGRVRMPQEDPSTRARSSSRSVNLSSPLAWLGLLSFINPSAFLHTVNYLVKCSSDNLSDENKNTGV